MSLVQGRPRATAYPELDTLGVLFVLLCLTASFDVFLSVRVATFTLRFNNIVMVLFCLAGVLVYRGRLTMPAGGLIILAFCALETLFVFNTSP